MTDTLTDHTDHDTGRKERRADSFPGWIVAITAAALGAALLAGSLLVPSRSSSPPTSPTVATEITTAVTQTVTNEAPVAVTLTDVSEIAAAAVDSVVVVDVVINTRGPFDASGSGSGVIVDAEGLIITNAHVIEDAASISVELTDGSRYPATILAQDTADDIAVLDIDATGLTSIEFGSTADLAVGDPVIAIGNPLALEGGPSVSTGIVSALDRVLEGEGTTLTGIIQTDAAITEGSSGGALLDVRGNLVGITTAVGVSSVGVEGIAFAVPIETVSEVLAALDGV